MLFILLTLVLTAVYIANALPVEGPTEYPRYIDIPDDEGNLHQVDLKAPPDMSVLAEVSRNPANNLYFLFTRRNPDTAQTLVMNDPSSVLLSNFNPSKPTVVIAHGWLNNQNSDLNSVIRNAYLQKDDANVIVLDWRRLAISGYVTAATGVPAVGRGLGLFLAFLQDVTGTSYSLMHLVGFSLGAHLVGNAGRQLNGRIARITGLDPAGPLWNYNSNRLSAADAIYVEAIHTNGGIVGLGIGTAIGHADFFPNGGNSQPGCLTPICDHNRAWELFASSVTNNHLAGVKCANSMQITLNTCRGVILNMGNDDLTKFGTGSYRVNTGRRYPF